MTKYILSIGLNDKDTHLQKYSIAKSRQIVEKTLKNLTDGYTIYTTQGGYKHNNGVFVQEKSIRVELLFTPYDTVLSIIKTLKSPQNLNQETIALETIETNSVLI